MPARACGKSWTAIEKGHKAAAPLLTLQEAEQVHAEVEQSPRQLKHVQAQL
jgi:hypothetical protein